MIIRKLHTLQITIETHIQLITWKLKGPDFTLEFNTFMKQIISHKNLSMVAVLIISLVSTWHRLINIANKSRMKIIKLQHN